MLVEKFPYGPHAGQLEEKDFALFQHRFRLLITQKIPVCGDVNFVEPGGTAPKMGSDPRQNAVLDAAISQLQNGQESPRRINDVILLPFPIGEARKVVAVISRIDPLIVERGTNDWLVQCRDELMNQFLLAKGNYVDHETGVLNNAHFFEVLQSQFPDRQMCLLLVHLPPRLRSLPEVFRHAQLSASLLLDYTDNRFLVHHLGHGLFAILTLQQNLESIDGYCAGLVSYLRREGMYRVQVGASRQGPEGGTDTVLLDQAWTALQAAGKRGPFSFCDFGFLARGDRHPLRKMSPEVAGNCRNLVRKANVFSLILLHPQETLSGDEQLLSELTLPEGVLLAGDDRGALLCLPEVEGERALAIAKGIVQQLSEKAMPLPCCAGVSTFPFHSFSRAQTQENARKALLHAELLGENQAVLFEALSLNVSGDIYFADGDLNQSLREYRQGLKLEPDNVNLLNSLGVTYALLNSHSPARCAFTRVLEIEPENYMALYNLGLESQLRGDLTTAIDYLRKAIGCCPPGENEPVRLDIDLQLGKLYCRTGNSTVSLQHLERWCRQVDERRRGEVLRFLGEACLDVGRIRDAMQWLQRAQRHNPYDPEVLSLLGSAVWQAGEGAEIALSLCSKGVELAPGNALLRLRLARVQFDQGLYGDALANLSHCRSKAMDGAEVALLRAKICAMLEEKIKARNWARKALQRAVKGSDTFLQSKALLESLGG